MPTRRKTLSFTPAALLVALAGTALGQSTDPFPAQFQLSSLLPANGGDGSDGFVLNGIDANDYSGGSVSSAGDVNGDGIDDLIIGAYYADPNAKSKSGESYVVFGAAGVGSGGAINLSSLNGTNGFVLYGIDTDDRSGRRVSSAGDVNGDGIADLIIGARFADPNGNSQAGESYVVFGRDTAMVGDFPAQFELSSLLPANLGDGSTGFVITGIDAIDFSGTSISSAGDVNGDGIDDLIIGAERANPNGTGTAGESYVVFGRDTAMVGDFPASFNLSSLNGTNGFVINGIDAIDFSGGSVSSAGDVNGDGIADLIIGARYGDPNELESGESYVVFGRNTVLTPCDSDANGNGLVDFADLNVVLGNWLNDYTPGTGPGDVNLDGIVDFTDINGVLGNWLVVCP